MVQLVSNIVLALAFLSVVFKTIGVGFVQRISSPPSVDSHNKCQSGFGRLSSLSERSHQWG